MQERVMIVGFIDGHLPFLLLSSLALGMVDLGTRKNKDHISEIIRSYTKVNPSPSRIQRHGWE